MGMMINGYKLVGIMTGNFRTFYYKLIVITDGKELAVVL